MITKFLIVVFLFLAACATAPQPVTRGVVQEILPLSRKEKAAGQSEGLTLFKTAYGNIAQGSSMSTVMSVLGQPRAIDSEKQSEMWYYDFGRGEKIAVYFINAAVSDVQAR